MLGGEDNVHTCLIIEPTG